MKKIVVIFLSILFFGSSHAMNEVHPVMRCCTAARKTVAVNIINEAGDDVGVEASLGYWLGLKRGERREVLLQKMPIHGNRCEQIHALRSIHIKRASAVLKMHAHVTAQKFGKLSGTNLVLYGVKSDGSSLFIKGYSFKDNEYRKDFTLILKGDDLAQTECVEIEHKEQEKLDQI